ncbi:hypothetical protein O3P69_006216 [Scylla paramamosain]|uniref:SMP-30/Gluconolactonase/LRE-like region domain-containing protein n=1 Tax=Scylla paramamosain TaxID=85552 RepID=A0AAW0U6R6_SCYPA
MGNTDVPENPLPYLGSLYHLAEDGKVTRVLDKVSISNGLAWSEDRRTFYYVDTCEYKLEAFTCDLEKGTLAREEEQHRTIWLWDRADWEAVKCAVGEISWDTVLTGEPHNDVNTLTTILQDLQYQHVPHRTYATSERRTIYDYRAGGLYPAFPDGLTIDTQGRLWVACFGAAKVHCINPRSGKIEDSVTLPTDHVTSVTFGGRDLDELYVTTTTKRLNKEQLAAQPSAGAVFRVTGLRTKGRPNADCKFCTK